MSAPDLQPFIPLRNLPNWAWQQRTWIMGILNATPDSFSDGGQVKGVLGAVEHACMMVKQGADIVDVGGQSTRPGATRVTTAEEVQRVVPVIRSDLFPSCCAALAMPAVITVPSDHWIIRSLGHLIIVSVDQLIAEEFMCRADHQQIIFSQSVTHLQLQW